MSNILVLKGFVTVCYGNRSSLIDSMAAECNGDYTLYTDNNSWVVEREGEIVKYTLLL